MLPTPSYLCTAPSYLCMAPLYLCTAPLSVRNGGTVINMAFPYFGGPKVQIFTLFREAITKKTLYSCYLGQIRDDNPKLNCKRTIPLSKFVISIIKQQPAAWNTFNLSQSKSCNPSAILETGVFYLVLRTT